MDLSVVAYERYEILSEIGRGASACVQLARDKNTHQEIVLKVFHPKIFHDAYFQKRILREIQIAQELDHPNIVKVLDVLSDQDPPAIVLQYIEGTNLEHLQASLPYIVPEIAVLITIEILKALQYAHSKGVIHRDLKPENVLISKQGEVFVTDFGLAKILDHSDHTRSNVILGSPDYMSPEQAKGDTVDIRSDLFASASILYFLVTGTRPFRHDSPLATLSAIRDKTPESPQKRNPKLNSQLSRILLKGLEKDPHRRYQSAQQFAKALKDYLNWVGMEDQVQLKDWMQNSSAFTRETLTLISTQLVKKATQSLQQKNWGLFLEELSHLSLLAPEHPALPRLSHLYSNKRKQRKTLYFSLSLIFIFFVIGFISLPKRATRLSHQYAYPFDYPRPKATSDSVKQVFNTKNTELKNKKSPQKGVVRFNVAKDVNVYWDGRRVDPSTPLTNQTLGEHFLLLERPGYDPIRVTVKVGETEPIVINAGR